MREIWGRCSNSLVSQINRFRQIRQKLLIRNRKEVFIDNIKEVFKRSKKGLWLNNLKEIEESLIAIAIRMLIKDNIILTRLKDKDLILKMFTKSHY